MRHGSLFSGIGGFDLAAEWMGWENVFHCEWNPFGQKVLHYYWPEAEQFTDITKSDFTKYANKIDILTGGFPCQPYSSAGKRLGKEDERHLWPEMLRAIWEIQPTWIVGENVFGLVNWNGGMVFDEVQADLEAQGYEVQPYVLPAAAVNAPHRRDRVWFVAKNTNKDGWRSEQWKEQSNVGQQWNFGAGDNERIRADNEEVGDAAYSDNNGLNQCDCKHEKHTSEGRLNALCDTCQSFGHGDAADTDNNDSRINIGKFFGQSSRFSKKGNAADTNGIGLRRESNWIRDTGFIGKNNKRNDWKAFPTVSPICNGDDGLSDRLDSITFSKWRTESIKAGANAIVPQVALQIFKAIEQYELKNS
jgi:DNA (cytosine-5)-methyltransferase 1